METFSRCFSKVLFPFFVFCMLFSVPGMNKALLAQPSDAQMKEDLVKNKKGLISIRFTTEGTRRLENLKYVWLRNAEVIREANIPEYPDVKLLVSGTMVYDIVGTKFIFTRFRVAYNSYLGIPNPTEDDIRAFIEKNGTEKLVGNALYNMIVSEVSYEISAEPDWEWHNPKSVSFNVIGIYEVLSNVEKAVESVEQAFRVRFYTDKVKGSWTSMMTTPRKKKVLSSRKVSPDEYARLKREETLGVMESERKAQATLAALPKVILPEFNSDVDAIMYTHKMLRECTPEELEAYLMRVLAPGYFLEGSNTMLNQRGADIINDAVRTAHKLHITYAESYCPDPKIAHRQSGMVEFYDKTGKGKTRIAVGQFGGTYKEGVLVGKQWKITDLSVSVPNNPDQIAYIRSFSDPNKLCGSGKAAATDQPTTQPAVRNNPAPQPVAISWKKVSLPEIKLQIQFPETEPQKTVKDNMYQYMVGHSTGTYALTAWKLGQTVTKAKASQMIDNVAANFAKNMKFSIAGKSGFAYKGNEGKSFSLSSGDKVISYKSVVVGDIMYQVLISSTRQALTKELENKFFGSFAVTN